MEDGAWYLKGPYVFIKLTNWLIWGGGEYLILIYLDLKKASFKFYSDISLLFFFTFYFKIIMDSKQL